MATSNSSGRRQPRIAGSWWTLIWLMEEVEHGTVVATMRQMGGGPKTTGLEQHPRGTSQTLITGITWPAGWADSGSAAGGAAAGGGPAPDASWRDAGGAGWGMIRS